MIRALQAFALAAVSFAVGCGSGKRPEASEAPPEPEPAVPAAPAAPAAPEPEPSAEQLPLEDDFVPQAEEQITAANYRRELDELEKEITAEMPHQ